MKTLLLLTFQICLINFKIAGAINSVPATEPQQIAPTTQALYEPAYYQKQVELWKQEIQKNDENPNAWLNYYLASRTVNMLSQESSPKDLNEILQNLATKVPNTYEHHYLTYLNGKGDDQLFHHIESAYALDPDRTETYSHMINHHLIHGNEKKIEEFCRRWLESGEISPGILNWNYNALIGLEKNAILLTNGDNDTYPAWMLQKVNQIRPDIAVINVHLLKNQSYADRSFSQIDIAAYPTPVSKDVVWENDLIPVTDYIMENSSRPLYFNITLPKKIRESYKAVLYTVGLAFKYSPGYFDNISTLQDNYENKFLKDYLKVGFVHDKSATVINAMNVNYLPSFVTLYKHYLNKNKTTKADEIRAVLLNIGRANGKEEQILELISAPKTWDKDVETYMDIKSIDKTLKELRPGLWAADTETTNANYEQFLMDLLKNKEFELLEICKTKKTDWMSLLPDKHKDLTEIQAYSIGGRPDAINAPVTNISYEAALAYCEWLTLAYNGYPKKKKHPKVTFRLPTEQEWEYAARSGHIGAAYPWGGQYYTNAKGCYLSNFKSHNDKPCTDCNHHSPDIDGGFFLVPGDAYFPNDFGLYGMSGNAAEMVVGGKIAKGGSWEDLPADCTIEAKKSITGTSPSIGFRVFMELSN